MLLKSRSCCKFRRMEGAKEGVLAMYPTTLPPLVGVRVRLEMVMLAEIASQIGASWTIAIKLPLGGPEEEVVDDTEPQLLRIPAAKTTPKSIAGLRLNIRLKGLLLS